MVIQPTLVLGIGGIGGRILSALSTRLPEEDRKLVATILLDTNVNDGKGIKVTTANDEDHPAAFSSTETPLRSHVRLIKKAEKTETDFLSEAPNNYRLAGAVYKFYSDASCTKQANDFNNKPAELTTDAKGETRIMEMLPGTYYVKETTAPSGFCIDGGKDTPKVYKITLTLGSNGAKSARLLPGGTISYNVSTNIAGVVPDVRVNNPNMLSLDTAAKKVKAARDYTGQAGEYTVIASIYGQTASCTITLPAVYTISY